MRIALVAMSGVRSHNPELTTLGLSLPGFIECGKTIASLPNLGLPTLAALTDRRRAGFKRQVEAWIDRLVDRRVES